MPRLAANIAMSMLLWLTLYSAAAAGPWLRYENSNFVAYSNASDDDVFDLLHELEYVRAAAAQTPGFFIPEDRPRTLVLLPETEDEFARLAEFETMAGFAQPLENGSAIVLPTSGGNPRGRIIARHEFAHTMLFNDWFRYPHWYAEGFAEVISSIVVDRRRNEFTVGEKPNRYGRRIRPLIDWDQLVGTNFDAHNLVDQKLIQAAYTQNWLLLHYLVLNGERDYSSELDQYFSQIFAGEDSQRAFVDSFGFSAADLWETELRQYAKRPPTKGFIFDPTTLDLNFNIGAANNDDIEPLLTYLTDKADARRHDAVGLPSLERLPGIWDQLKYEDQCSDPLTFGLRPGTNLVTIEGFYSAAGAPPIPALFAMERMGDDAFRLTNVTADEYPNVVISSDYRISMRNDNVFCFDELPLDRACSGILHRCERAID